LTPRILLYAGRQSIDSLREESGWPKEPHLS
jgi:hypothetical protein